MLILFSVKCNGIADPSGKSQPFFISDSPLIIELQRFS